MPSLDDLALDQLFRAARSVNSWEPTPVPEGLLQEVYGLAALGPTSANCLPLRIVFISTPEAKARLAPAVAPGNRAKFRAAPVTAVFAHDLQFCEFLPRTFPHEPDAPSWFTASPGGIETAALRNGTLQAAYFMLAARAKGLDCGPMGGFDAARFAADLFPDGRWAVNFLCGLGYGNRAGLHPRLPRLAFNETCQVI